MSNPPRVMSLATYHIVRALRAQPDFAANLPGGVWRGVAPASVQFPHVVFSYVTGDDRPALQEGGWGPSNLIFLIKVMDQGSSASRAMDVVNWLEGVLFSESIQGSTISGVPVSIERDSPFSLPVVENDTIFQQEGGMYRLWVEDFGGA